MNRDNGAVFLLFRERHLLLECGWTFYIQLPSHRSTYVLYINHLLFWNEILHFLRCTLSTSVSIPSSVCLYVTDQSEEAEEVREGIPHHSRAAGTAGGAHREIWGRFILRLFVCVSTWCVSAGIYTWLCAYEYLHDPLGRACVCSYAFNLG